MANFETNMLRVVDGFDIKFVLGFLPNENLLSNEELFQVLYKTNKTDYITGCCFFTSWKTIEKLEGFDESYNMYGEDVDLCLRANKMGINCYFIPEAKLWHHVSASIGGNWSDLVLLMLGGSNLLGRELLVLVYFLLFLIKRL